MIIANHLLTQTSCP